MIILNQQLNPELALVSYPLKELKYTKHALERAAQKGLPIIPRMVISAGEVVEAEPSNQKIVVRLKRLLGTEDLCLVMVAQQYGWIVLTTYANHHLDNHHTLKLKGAK